MNSPNKAYTLLSIFFFTFIILGFWLFGRSGLMWCTILSLLVHWLLYFYADQKILNTYPIRRIQGQDPWQLVQMLQDLSEKARIPCPQLYFYESPAVNAFSIGRTRHESRLLISQASVDKLSLPELQALLALEVAKIKRRDTVLMSMLSSLLEMILVLSLFFEKDNKMDQFASRRNAIHHFFLLLFAPVAWFVRRLLLSEKTYYSIDHLALSLVDDPQVMVDLLEKMQSYANNQALDIPVSMAHLFVVNPLTKPGWGRYFQAQPSTESRVLRLQNSTAN